MGPSHSIADRDSYATTSTFSFFFSYFYEILMNVSVELTIASVERPFVQIHLAPTSALASWVTVETAEIIAF